MKRSIVMLAAVGVLVGCSSTPKDEQQGVQVEDRTPSASQPAPSTTTTPPREATTAPAKSQAVRVDPLRDPSSILSRRSVYFDYDSNAVKDEFKPLVSAHAKYLSQNRRKVTVQGNTDERGSREYNLALGQRRADSVKQMMTLLGAPSGDIETVSFGEEKPRAQGSSEQAFAENRRADIVYQGE